MRGETAYLQEEHRLNSLLYLNKLRLAANAFNEDLPLLLQEMSTLPKAKQVAIFSLEESIHLSQLMIEQSDDTFIRFKQIFCALPVEIRINILNKISVSTKKHIEKILTLTADDNKTPGFISLYVKLFIERLKKGNDLIIKSTSDEEKRKCFSYYQKDLLLLIDKISDANIELLQSIFFNPELFFSPVIWHERALLKPILRIFKEKLSVNEQQKIIAPSQIQVGNAWLLDSFNNDHRYIDRPQQLPTCLLRTIINYPDALPELMSILNTFDTKVQCNQFNGFFRNDVLRYISTEKPELFPILEPTLRHLYQNDMLPSFFEWTCPKTRYIFRSVPYLFAKYHPDKLDLIIPFILTFPEKSRKEVFKDIKKAYPNGINTLKNSIEDKLTFHLTILIEQYHSTSLLSENKRTKEQTVIKELYEQLHTSFKQYLKTNKDSKAILTLQKKWQSSIEKAEPVINQSKTWQNTLANATLCLTFIGFLYLVHRYITNPQKLDKQNITFFIPLIKTENQKIINELKQPLLFQH